MNDPEIPELLKFRNSIFSNVDENHWESMGCTGVVAIDDSDVVGFVPLQFRQQVLRPGVVAPVVYENAVGVSEPMRSRGIGSGMIEAAAEFIGNRADALFVIRGGESSPGYRFYRKSGHSDLSYASFFSHQRPETLTQDRRLTIMRTTEQEWNASEDEIIAYYQENYGEYGGGKLRYPGYWAEIFAGHVFKEREWFLLVARDGRERLIGYAIFTHGTWMHHEDIHLYEITGDDEKTVEALLAAGGRLAPGRPLRAPQISLANPVAPVLRRLGFDEERTEPHIMARIVRPHRLFIRLADSSEEVSDFRSSVHLVCSTPHRTVDLQSPPQPENTIYLEMKEHLLARLLLCRLELIAAIENELVRCRGGNNALLETLARICRPARWVQWFTDYV